MQKGPSRLPQAQSNNSNNVIPISTMFLVKPLLTFMTISFIFIGLVMYVYVAVTSLHDKSVNIVSEECCTHKIIITWFPLQQTWIMECKMELEAAWGNLHQHWKTIDIVIAFELRSIFSPQHLSSLQYWISRSLSWTHWPTAAASIAHLNPYVCDIKAIR